MNSTTWRNTVDAYLNDNGDEAADALIESSRRGVTDVDIAYLADGLAHSGQVLQRNPRAIDIASTGGPGSLSTLLTPLALHSMGFVVPKLAVPGRPAGAIDSLAQIRGFTARLTFEELTRAIESGRIAHIMADGTFAPADMKLFRRRQDVGAVNVPPLVIASLLAKKVALGISVVGLDVRVFRGGNLGSDTESAREHAKRFNRVAKLLGLTGICFISPQEGVPQPLIGRSESLVALKRILDGAANSWLHDHATTCLLMALRTAAKLDAEHAKVPSLAVLRMSFQTNLQQQGASYDAFEDAARQAELSRRRVLTAPRSCFVEVDLQRLRNAIVESRSGGEFADDVGVELVHRPGSWCEAGAPVARIRCGADAAFDRLADAFAFNPLPTTASVVVED